MTRVEMLAAGGFEADGGVWLNFDLDECLDVDDIAEMSLAELDCLCQLGASRIHAFRAPHHGPRVTFGELMEFGRDLFSPEYIRSRLEERSILYDILSKRDPDLVH